MVLILVVSLLLIPAPAWAALHSLAWTYTTQANDVALIVERCHNRRQSCAMQVIATLAPDVRRYVDMAVARRQSYCYQVWVETFQGRTQRSNRVCTP